MLMLRRVYAIIASRNGVAWCVRVAGRCDPAAADGGSKARGLAPGLQCAPRIIALSFDQPHGFTAR